MSSESNVSVVVSCVSGGDANTAETASDLPPTQSGESLNLL